MRLGQAFANFGNKVKNFGLRVGSTLSHVAPKAIKIGSFVAGALSRLPGTIGTAAGYLHKGLDVANNIISALPSSQIKTKLQDLSGKVNDTVNHYEPKINNAANTAKVIGDTASQIINTVKQKII